MPDELQQRVDRLVDAGLVESRSEFFQQAAAMYFMTLGMGGAQVESIIEDADDIEAAREELHKLREAVSEGRMR